MSTYSASDKLVALLLENGFKEVTEQYFPHSFVRLQHKGESYHPAYFQRAFRYATGSALIILNYLKIRMILKTSVLVESRHVNEEEIKAIMAFGKLPAKQQQTLAYEISNLKDLQQVLKKHAFTRDTPEVAKSYLMP